VNAASGATYAFWDGGPITKGCSEGAVGPTGLFSSDLGKGGEGKINGKASAAPRARFSAGGQNLEGGSFDIQRRHARAMRWGENGGCDHGGLGVHEMCTGRLR